MYLHMKYTDREDLSQRYMLDRAFWYGEQFERAKYFFAEQMQKMRDSLQRQLDETHFWQLRKRALLREAIAHTDELVHHTLDHWEDA